MTIYTKRGSFKINPMYIRTMQHLILLGKTLRACQYLRNQMPYLSALDCRVIVDSIELAYMGF